MLTKKSSCTLRRHSGPKDSTGKSVLKPIARKETKLSGVQITLIACGTLLFLLGSFIVGKIWPDKEHFPVYLLAAGAILVAAPASYAAYTVLRNQETDGFLGQELWKRIGICAVVYSVLWILMPVMGYAFPGTDNSIGSIIGLVGMIAVGGVIGMLSLDFDYLIGVVHYGMYLGLCLVARVICGLDTLPGSFQSGEEVPSTVISMASQFFLS